MAGATTETLVNILQEHYLPGIERQFNADSPLLRFLRQNTEDVNGEGEKAIIAIQTGLNEGGGFHGESADVAESGYPTVKRVEVDLKQLTFRARLTYKLMKKAKTNKYAFARGMQLQMTSTREAFILRANTYLWGDGSGVICRVKSEDLAANDLVVLDEAFGLSDGGTPAALIRPGMVLHLLDTKGFTDGVSNDRGKGTVSTVDDDTAGEITVVFRTGYTLAAVAAGDYVYIENTIDGWSDPGETQDNAPAMGMLAFYDSDLADPLQGLAVADEPMWKPKKHTIAEATATVDLRTAKNALKKQERRGRLLFAISSYEVHERYTAKLDDKVEFRNVRTLDGMWEVGTFDGRPWFMDHTAPDGRLFFVPAGHPIQRYAASKFIDIVSDSGGGPLNLVPNKTVFDVLLTALYEYGVKRRNVLVSGTGMNWAY